VLPCSAPGLEVARDPIAREVLHRLLMLPYYSVLDDIKFKVDANHNVTLVGDVVNPVTKSDAEAAVKRVEGVESVKKEIEVLSPSPMDQQIRIAEYNAIYRYDGLTKYAWGTIPPIHIIVKNGHVRLEGVIDNEADKNMVGLRANSVTGVFSVENNLQVVNPTGGK
jgi:hyperosmotically inducible protein